MRTVERDVADATSGRLVASRRDVAVLHDAWPAGVGSARGGDRATRLVEGRAVTFLPVSRGYE